MTLFIGISIFLNIYLGYYNIHDTIYFNKQLRKVKMKYLELLEKEAHSNDAKADNDNNNGEYGR